MSRQLLALAVAVAIGTCAIYAPPRASEGHADPLYALRVCESGNDYAKDTGNGFYGAYQFSLGTWQTVGGVGYPHEAAPEEQDARAWELLTRYGPQHWPACQYRMEGY